MKFDIVLAPAEHTRSDLKRAQSTPCCVFYLRMKHLQFPRKGWVDLVPTIVELAGCTAGLFGSGVEFDVKFMRGPFSIDLRRDLTKTEFDSSFDSRASVTVTLKANGRAVRGGRISLPLNTYATLLHRSIDTFLKGLGPARKHRALVRLREEVLALVNTADIRPVRRARSPLRRRAPVAAMNKSLCLRSEIAAMVGSNRSYQETECRCCQEWRYAN
jgi:hypothetical protein